METGWLALTAFWVGLTHTLLGPDHYIPFVALAKARNWTLQRTIVVTLLCGLGHVGSSVLLGLLGLVGGLVVQNLTSVEELRGDWAAWLLIGFGLAYATWGVGRAMRAVPHSHLHGHADGTWHAHEHSHEADHLHVHEPAVPSSAANSLPTLERLERTDSGQATSAAKTASARATRRAEVTPWVLFVIFLFGPCEPLIPLFIYPAAGTGYGAAALVALAFAAATLLAMTFCVVLLAHGTTALRWRRMERLSHALAGVAILACGLAVKFGL